MRPNIERAARSFATAARMAACVLALGVLSISDAADASHPSAGDCPHIHPNGSGLFSQCDGGTQGTECTQAGGDPGVCKNLGVPFPDKCVCADDIDAFQFIQDLKNLEKMKAAFDAIVLGRRLDRETGCEQVTELDKVMQYLVFELDSYAVSSVPVDLRSILILDEFLVDMRKFVRAYKKCDVPVPDLERKVRDAKSAALQNNNDLFPRNGEPPR